VKPGSKYGPLFDALSRGGQDPVTFTFNEIEALLGEPLPRSARASRGWWSNRRGSPQASAWMRAGYHVQRLDLEGERVTFAKPARRYQVRREGDRVLWDGELVRGLRDHMALSQAQFAHELGVRQQTVSEWETGSYAPSRAMCKYLSLIAERAGFNYGEGNE
jgi:DNA-binding XRE family transcriptional regulator